MREPLVANVAFIGPFPSVHPYMGLEVAQLLERLGAIVALVN